MMVEFFEQLRGIVESKTNIMSIFINNKLGYILSQIDGKWYIPIIHQSEYYSKTYIPTDIHGVMDLIHKTKDISEIRLGTIDGNITKLSLKNGFNNS